MPTTLICLPFAGGGAGLFRSWTRWAPEDIRIHPPRLPGRESRLEEPAIDDMARMVRWLETETADLRQQDFALFGHSMGAAIAYAFALHLQDRGLPAPSHLFVSACVPLPLHKPEPLHQMAAPRLRAFLRDYDPERYPFDDHPDLWELFEPLLRADFRLVETYRPQEAAQIVTCPLTALSADADTIAPSATMAGWHSRTSGGFTHITLPGQHLFLRDAPDRLFTEIRKQMSPHPALG